NILLKVKKFVDDEAVVIGFEEKLTNNNEAKLDNFGNIKRSSSKDGLVAAGTLGTIIVKDSHGHMFGVGSGLNDETRDEIWANQSKYLGKMLKFKHFPQGVKECPRHPVFIGFRDRDDL
ncbi:ATP-dependent DNA ligase, partial [bacterium]|nr:ATP-dependent DNA ligase [bacterium]